MIGEEAIDGVVREKFAFWKTLYTPGHDAALLLQTEHGWRLQGTAVYLHEGQPASIRYSLDLERDWSTRCGSIDGFVGAKGFHRYITRDEHGWTLDGKRQSGLEGIVDWTLASRLQRTMLS